MSKEAGRAISLKRFDIRNPLSSFRDRLSPIFTPPQELKADVKASEIEVDTAENISPEPDHLYVLVHGFNSKPGHLKYIAKKMRETLGAHTVSHLIGGGQRVMPGTPASAANRSPALNRIFVSAFILINTRALIDFSAAA
jgi:hypothetical protein